MKTTELALNIYKHYRTKNKFASHYYGIVANLGMVNIAQICGEGSEADLMIRELLAMYPDQIEHPKYNFPSYSVCGTAKAKAVWCGISEDVDQVIEFAEEMMTAKRHELGMISHPAASSLVWIDVAAAVVPFLLYAGLKTGNKTWLDESAKQIFAMYDFFMDESCGLLHQAANFRGEGKMSADHWSRGNGWGIMPLAEVAAYLPDDHPDKARAIEYLRAHAKALLPYQSENGMWRQEITVQSCEGYVSYEETSGTGLIAYAIGLGIRCGALDKEIYMPVFERAIKGLLKVSVREDYSIYNSCPGCLYPNDGSILAYVNHNPTYKDENHGAGPVILALAEAHRLGITEVEVTERSLFVTADELAKVRAIMDEDSQIGEIWRALKARTLANTAEDKLVQSGDTQMWWHLVWERMSDAAFVYAVEEKDQKLGKWIHDRTMEICNRDVQEWIGPSFRGHSPVPVAALETAHVINAVADAYDLCPGLFTDDEKKFILECIREKGLIPCGRFCPPGTAARNNWYCVISGGFATAAALLGDEQAVEDAVGLYNNCLKLYNSDGYTESLQYGNYASLSLIHMRRVLVRYNPALAERLSLEPIANTVKLAAASFLYMKPLGTNGNDNGYPHSINFADSAAIYRPTADVLLAVAEESEDATKAGVARWLFDVAYADPTVGPDELATFSFFPQYSWNSLISLPNAAKAITPKDAGIPTKAVFNIGNAFVRDSWDDTKTVLGVMVGAVPYNVTAHRHRDQNAFTLTAYGDRFFIDPGHCCYRLESYGRSTSTGYHNTWDFIGEDETKYTQRGTPFGVPFTKYIEYDAPEGFDVIASDAAAAYGEHFKRAERIFVCAFPHVMFIIDRIETDIPVKMVSHFVINNRDGKMNNHMAYWNKFVLRRGKGALKFFTFPVGEEMTMKQRYGLMHDYYHPLPNMNGQGREGSALIYDYTSTEFSTKHTVVHPFAISPIGQIPGWHIVNEKDNTVFTVLSPGNVERWQLRLTDDSFEVEKLQ